MAYTVNFNKTPSQLLLPPMFADVELFQLEERWSQANALRMYFISLKIEAPAAYANRFHDELLIFGKRPWPPSNNPDRRPDAEYDAYRNLDDPDAEHELSWRFSNGIRMFADICRVLRIDLAGEVNIDQLVTMLNAGGKRFGVELVHTIDNRDGRTRVQIGQVYALGTQQPRLSQARAGLPAADAAKLTNSPSPTASQSPADAASDGESSSDQVAARRRSRATAATD